MTRYVKTAKDPRSLDAFFEASAEELRVLWLFFDAAEPLCAEDVLTGARLSSLGEAKDAIAFWRGAGLLRAAKKRESADAQESAEKEGVTAPHTAKKAPVRAAEELPNYSGAELSGMIDGENLASFIEACQQIYGKVLSTTDINILVGLREELHLDLEYICMLVSYCAGRKTASDAPKKPMRYVEKMAFALYEKGVTDARALEEELSRRIRAKTREGKLRKLFGIGERALSTEEEAAFVRWCEEFHYDDEVIGLAYDLTVAATQKAPVKYADKILTRWNEAGCKTVADAEAFVARERSEKNKSATRPKSEKEKEKDGMRSFDVDDFFARALDRSYGGTDGGDK